MGVEGHHLVEKLQRWCWDGRAINVPEGVLE